MKETFRVLMLGFMFIIMTFLQIERDINSTTQQRLKASITRAAHDASLQVVDSLVGEGYIVFDREKARAAFEQTLQSNLQLKSDLTPKPHTLLHDQMYIIAEEYIDDYSGVTFPYNYRNDEMRMYKTIYGPAVIFKIRVHMPRVSRFGYDGDVTKDVIYEYPFL